MLHEKMSNFVLFPLFKFSLAINLRHFEFGSHCNTLRLFIKNDMVSDLNMSHGKMSRFCFIFIAWVYFSHKTE